MTFRSRQKKLSVLAEEIGLDSVLVTSPADICYYTGIALPEGERGFLLAGKGKPLLFVSPLLNSLKSSSRVELSFAASPKKIRESLPPGRVGIDENDIPYGIVASLRKKGTRFVPFSRSIKEPRMVKDSSELSAVRKVARLTESVMEKISLPGRSEADIAREIEVSFRNLDLGRAFPTIVASGKNSSLIHYTPGRRRIGSRDVVIVDCGARFSGYCADITRTFLLNPGREQRKVYEDVLEIQDSLIDFVEEGIKLSEVEKLYETMMKRKRYKPMHGFGHGIGLEAHERPDYKDTLKKGMVITVEPGVYIPGRFGIRIEDMLLVGKKAKLITRISRNPVWKP